MCWDTSDKRFDRHRDRWTIYISISTFIGRFKQYMIIPVIYMALRGDINEYVLILNLMYMYWRLV